MIVLSLFSMTAQEECCSSCYSIEINLPRYKVIVRLCSLMSFRKADLVQSILKNKKNKRMSDKAPSILFTGLMCYLARKRTDERLNLDQGQEIMMHAGGRIMG